ncbi:hypothetical protein AB0K60_02665 [Thermopolyspora sp. NPDC052614]|uniref:hypothetical protein n=1 Tax=Thermopolyspora sp. NPDC052614 TaxID=3155682 RepID=UPI00343225B0
MRLLSLTAAAVLAVTIAGCSTVDKAQACLESSKIVADTVAKIGSLANDPAAMEKALNDGAARLSDAADKAGNTTLNEALDDLSKSLEGLNVKDVNDAVDAAQKAATDGAAAAEKIARECT